MRGSIPPRLLPPAPSEVESLLRAVEEALLGSGLRSVRTSLSSVDGAESSADVGLVVEETLRNSRPARLVPSVVVEGRTDDVDERVRSALLATRRFGYQRIGGAVYVEILAHEVDVTGRIEQARARSIP